MKGDRRPSRLHIGLPFDDPYGEDEETGWGACSRCRKTQHLYSVSPVSYPEVCHACRMALLEEAKP